MLRELINFTDSLDPDFKALGMKPKEGLHVLMQIEQDNEASSLNKIPIHFEIYSNKFKEETTFITKCKFLANFSWYVASNKSFDKGIHTCSPFCVAFKIDFLEGGGLNVTDRKKNKKDIPNRFKNKYFSNSFNLLESDLEKNRYKSFEDFFVSLDFINLIELINNGFLKRQKEIDAQISILKVETKNEKAVPLRLNLQEKLKDLEFQKISVRTDYEYIIFYLDEPIDLYKKTHEKYLADKLFNDIEKYPIINDMGIGSFMNGYNSKKPYLLHQTANFNIQGRISSRDAVVLNEFSDLLNRKLDNKKPLFSNPLPIFIMNDDIFEIKSFISKDSGDGRRFGYKEIVEMFEKSVRKHEWGNYYLLFYQFGQVMDFDFVSKFEYTLRDSDGERWQVKNIFNLKSNGGELLPNTEIDDVFDFQMKIIMPIFNENLIIPINEKKKRNEPSFKYFEELKPEYCKSYNTFLQIIKYRKAFYDFVYKSNRKLITQLMFNDIMLSAILEDMRLDEFKIAEKRHKEEYNIKLKLNIWFSFYEKFNGAIKTEKSMENQSKELRNFMLELVKGDIDINEEKQFCYVLGQLMRYANTLSESSDRSYQRVKSNYFDKNSITEYVNTLNGEVKKYSYKLKDTKYYEKFHICFSKVELFDTSDTPLSELERFILGGFFASNIFLEKDNS